MKAILFAALVLGGCCGFAAASAAGAPQAGHAENSLDAGLAKLDWIRGPKRIDLFHRASLEYETDTKRLDWAVIGRAGNGNSAVNFNTRILGVNGVTSAVLVADPAKLDTAIGEFRNTLKRFDYTIGQRYAEYRPGDKVAKFS
jgi:uncharacterized membrane-anchored protein